MFFNHQDLPLPIGKSVGPDGKLAVRITPGERVEATCYFSQKLADAAVIFALVEEGILTATSVGFGPLSEPVRLGDDAAHPFSLLAGFCFEEWELHEWSIVGVPCNPYCGRLRSYLDAGRSGASGSARG